MYNIALTLTQKCMINNKSTIKDRAIAFIKLKGLSMRDFERSCGLSTGYITSMRKGFGAEKLNNVLIAYPDLNRDWLLYGEGEMLKSPKPASVSVVGNDNAVNNSNCKISHGGTASSVVDSLQAENTDLRKEIAELRSALLDLTRQNQRLTDKLLSLMDGPNTSATARQ